MISVAECDRRIAAAVASGPTERRPLDRASGCILRREILADRPAPPFDRVMMDGFALDSSGLEDRRAQLRVQACVGAGHQPPDLRGRDFAIEVMTGGVLPSGCDAVVPVEWCETENGHVSIDAPREVGPQLYVHAAGSDGAAQRRVLSAGTRLDPAAIAVAATEGVTEVEVTRAPRIFLLTTGDEVVPAEATPRAWQIRGSHAPALRSLLRSWGEVEWRHHHAGDDETALRERLSEALAWADIVLTTGGVSMGRWDLLPEVLGELGVEEVLHRVAQRPGKPLWFGVRDQCLVFGLPGNPVSALCSARRHVWPALDRWSGATLEPAVTIHVCDDLEPLPKASRFIPVKWSADGWHAMAPKTSGSLHALVGSAGFVECPAGETKVGPETPLPFHGWQR